MGIPTVVPTGVERTFGQDEIIVSKTDLTGRITYANRVFMKIADYTEAEVLGQPHSLIRHPHMPRCVFKLLWDTISADSEIFAYVINMTKYGDHYWVLAHVTPTFDVGGKIVGYHSNRRVPERNAIAKVEPLYAALHAEEKKHGRVAGLEASTAMLEKVLEDAGVEYGEFVFSL